MSKLKVAGAVILVLGLIIGYGAIIFHKIKAQKVVDSAVIIELEYYRQTERIMDYYSRFKGEPTRASVVRKTLKAIDRLLPRYFPNGPYERKDLIAIAMVESGFEQYLTGKRGEYGLFQIMPESAKWAGIDKNHFDIDVNAEMAFFVLQKKHEKYQEYKMGIIAYNGVVKRSGKVSEKYWDLFTGYRTALDDILRDTSTPTAK